MFWDLVHSDLARDFFLVFLIKFRLRPSSLLSCISLFTLRITILTVLKITSSNFYGEIFYSLLAKQSKWQQYRICASSSNSLNIAKIL